MLNNLRPGFGALTATMTTMDGPGKAPYGQQQEEQEEQIPAYQTIAPSIFVPADVDFTKPLPDPLSEPGKLREEVLAQLDKHADAVHDNIYYMFNREIRRIRQECRQNESNLPPYLKAAPGLTEEEARSLPDNAAEIDEIFFIRSFCNEPKPGPYEVPPVFTHNDTLHLETLGTFGEPPRKSAEKMLLNLIKHGVMNLEGFARHVESAKQAKSEELKNEMLSNPSSSSRAPLADMMDTS